MRSFVVLQRPFDEPQPEQFGVTAADVERAPELVVTRYRAWFFIVIYALVFAVAAVVIFRSSGNVPVAAAFAVILVGAGSIVIIPLVMCCLCATEKLETRWLCRRFPALRGCLAYRDAMADFRRLTRPQPDHTAERDWWLRLEPAAFSGRVRAALETRALDPEPVVDPATSGFDCTIRDDGEVVLVRCEAGDEPVDIGVGRELVACLAETGAARAILVTEAGPSPALAAYLAERPIEVLAPSRRLATPADEA